MYRKITLVFVICIMSVNSFGQTRIGANLLLSTPKSETYSLGTGVRLQAKFNVANRLALGAMFSYEYFFNKSGWEAEWAAEWGTPYRNNNRTIAQVHPMLTYFLSDNKVKPYLGLEVGITMEFISYEFYWDNRWTKVSNTETSFSFSPVFGLEIPASEKLSFDIFAKYTGVDVSYFSAGLGFTFVIN